MILDFTQESFYFVYVMKSAPKQTVTYGEPMSADSARRVGQILLCAAMDSAASAENVAVSGAGLSNLPITATELETVAHVAGAAGTVPVFKIRDISRDLQVL